MLPILDLSTEAGRAGFDQRLAQLRLTASAGSDAAAVVAEIIANVRDQGDRAVVHYMRKWTDADFTADRIRVTPQEMSAALGSVDKKLRRAIERSIQHVREYQQHVMPTAPKPINIGGAALGLRFTPVGSVACAVPGGTAVLFSTLIMLAVPAMVAGVAAQNLSVLNPPPTRRGDELVSNIFPIVMATCKILGIEKLYRIGGAQAVAAVAFGTEMVDQAEMVAGPGNIFVQLAKQQLAGQIGTDGGFYGPSEIVTIADDSADPQRVAADLIAQAEHDPGKCFLVSWSRAVIDEIAAQVQVQLKKRKRRDAIEKALTEASAAVLVRNEDEAAAVADTIAAEHVSLAVADPRKWLDRLRNGGEFFLGDATPVAAGDYYAGPSHCLPTGTTARFTSGISVYTFLKRSGTVRYPKGMPQEAIDDIALLAETEGLDAHADSVRARQE